MRTGSEALTGLAALATATICLAGGAWAAPRQTEADTYTRYELLAPGSGKFRILYDVTANTPGARVYDNPPVGAREPRTRPSPTGPRVSR